MFETFWHYHSEIPKARRDVMRRERSLRYLPLAQESDDPSIFRIKVTTKLYAPSHVLTLRNNVDGWGRDVHGVYEGDSWTFPLQRENYPAGMTFKFFLDRTTWMEGADLTIPGPQNVGYDETSVRFAHVAPRFLHNYDNLRSAEDEAQQAVVHSRYSETYSATEPWDVIVIGSGMGGGVLADALAEKKTPAGKAIKVLVLDVGCLDEPSHVYNLPMGKLAKVESRHQSKHHTKQSGSKMFGGTHLNLGGRSVYWSGLIPRMRDWELGWNAGPQNAPVYLWPSAVRAYLGAGGTGYNHAEKLMRKHLTFGSFQENLIAQMKASNRFTGWDIVNTPRSQHQPDLGPQSNPAAPPGSYIELSTGTFSTAELLLDSLTNSGSAGRDNLHVNLNHLVTRLAHDGQHVSGVVCQDLVGNVERTYQARQVVLAAGSFESPKIALKSNLSDPHGKIGVGITDHPTFFADNKFTLPAGSPFAGKDKHARLFFYPAQAYHGHFFNVEIVINGRYWRVRHADDEVWEEERDRPEPTTIDFKFIMASPLVETNWLKLGVENDKLRSFAPPNQAGFDAQAAVKKLLRELLDFFQIPGIDLDRPTNPPTANLFYIWFGNEGTVQHAGGSLRMGEDGRPRVVDPDLKFQEYDNLYACDVSVFPMIPAANPSLTLAALALRLAGHLATKL